MSHPSTSNADKPVPQWVTDPALLASSVQPPIIKSIHKLNRTLPRSHDWHHGATLTPRQRASLILAHLSRRTARPWATASVDQYLADLPSVFAPDVVGRHEAYVQKQDRLSQEALHGARPAGECLSCRQRALEVCTLEVLTCVLGGHERDDEIRRRERGILRPMEQLRAALRSWEALYDSDDSPPLVRRWDLSNWARRPDMLAEDVRPVVVAAVKGLGRFMGPRRWLTDLTRAERVDMVQDRLVAELGGLVVGAAERGNESEVDQLHLIFAPHIVEAIAGKLREQLDERRAGDHSMRCLVATFWAMVNRTLWDVVEECEECEEYGEWSPPGRKGARRAIRHLVHQQFRECCRSVL